MQIKHILLASVVALFTAALVGCADAPEDDNTSQEQPKSDDVSPEVLEAASKGSGKVDPQMRMEIEHGWACMLYSDGSAYCCANLGGRTPRCFTQ